MMGSKSHILKGGECPPCRVFVDGKLVEHAIYADLKRGFVICARYPFRINRRRGELRRYRVKGRVTVEPIELA